MRHQPTQHPSPRHLPDGRTLVSRHVVALLTQRHVDHVRKRVPAVACDVASRTVLLDLDETEAILGVAARRPWQTQARRLASRDAVTQP